MSEKCDHDMQVTNVLDNAQTGYVGGGSSPAAASGDASAA